MIDPLEVSTHSRLKAAGKRKRFAKWAKEVSTHSRLKAAGLTVFGLFGAIVGFNTQPPEGGWDHAVNINYSLDSFNTQPPEGGWNIQFDIRVKLYKFQHTAA